MEPLTRTRPRLGLFLRASAYAYQAEILAGVHEECRRREFDVYCFAGGNLSTDEPWNFAYELARAEQLDGAILVPGTMGVSHEHPRALGLVEKFRGIPLSTIGVRYPAVASVCVDNSSGVEEVTSHLIGRHKRRQLAFLSGHGAEAEQRLSGYERSLREHSLELDRTLILSGDFSEGAGRLAIKELLFCGRLRCDALVAANDWMALGAVYELQRRGFRVPEDVAVVGFDDVEAASFLRPPLTTIRQPTRKLGVTAVSQIAAQLAGVRKATQIVLPTTMQLRESCGCFGHVAVAAEQTQLTSMPPPGSLAASSRGWIQRLKQADPSFSEHLTPGWAETLANSLIDELERGHDGAFIEALSEVLDRAVAFGSLAVWHRVLSLLRDRCVLAVSGATQLLLRMESIFSQAHVLISDREAQAQGQRRVRKEALSRQLHEMATEAHATQDFAELERVVARHCPLLHVPSCYVVATPSPDESTLLVAYQEGATPRNQARAERFSSAEVLPASVAPSERHTLIVHALSDERQPYGYCALELGPTEAALYKTVSELIAASMNEARARRELVEQATARAVMAQEMQLLSRIHAAILPRTTSVERLEIETCLLPASGVGGDYFDVLPWARGCWLGIGDVAGHGLQSGLVMLMVQSIVSALVRQEPTMSASRLWSTLNSVLRENIRERLMQDEHVTLTVIRYTSDGRLQFAGAHEDLIVYRNRTQKCELVPTPGIWAGIRDLSRDEIVAESECVLEAGDVLVLYTDGLIDAPNAAGEAFGIDRLCAAIEAARGAPVANIRQRVLSELRQFMREQTDDIALVMARYQ
ncbi:MAG: SpoIIE family protein phosphatase [Myxococcota bacterium]